MADRLNVKITVDVVDSADNSAFVKNVVEYACVPYEAFVEMEKVAVRFLEALTVLGDQEVERKKNKNKNK